MSFPVGIVTTREGGNGLWECVSMHSTKMYTVHFVDSSVEKVYAYAKRHAEQNKQLHLLSDKKFITVVKNEFGIYVLYECSSAELLKTRVFAYLTYQAAECSAISLAQKEGQIFAHIYPDNMRM